MTGEEDLGRLLAGMRPRLREGRHVFATVTGERPALRPVVTVIEDEGTTLVLRADDAAAAGLDGAFPCAWITLEVVSSLAAVGFLAAVTTALAGAGIGVNPVAGFHHDHLFVPWEQRDRALEVLQELSAPPPAPPTGPPPASPPTPRPSSSSTGRLAD